MSIYVDFGATHLRALPGIPMYGAEIGSKKMDKNTFCEDRINIDYPWNYNAAMFYVIASRKCFSRTTEEKCVAQRYLRPVNDFTTL